MRTSKCCSCSSDPENGPKHCLISCCNKQLTAGCCAGTRVTTQNNKFIYEYQMVKSSAALPSNLYWFDVGGAVPCCINASVPDYQTDAPVPVGYVMGSCNPNATSGSASITWRGTVFSQNISDATLLSVSVRSQPGADICPRKHLSIQASISSAMMLD